MLISLAILVLQTPRVKLFWKHCPWKVGYESASVLLESRHFQWVLGAAVSLGTLEEVALQWESPSLWLQQVQVG